MTTYRTGRHHGVTIVREAGPRPCDEAGQHYYCFALGENAEHATDQLVAVVVNGDQALAERIVALLNGDERMRAVTSELDRYRAADPEACTCDHDGLDEIFHLLPCPVAAKRVARRTRPGPPHPTCVETTAHAELVAGTRSFICGPDCPPPPRDPDMDAMIAMQNWDAGERDDVPADSCTCAASPDPVCPVHHGRRARGHAGPNRHLSDPAASATAPDAPAHATGW